MLVAMDFGSALATGGFGLFWLVAILAFTKWDEAQIRARRTRRQFAGNRYPIAGTDGPPTLSAVPVTGRRPTASGRRPASSELAGRALVECAPHSRGEAPIRRTQSQL